MGFLAPCHMSPAMVAAWLSKKGKTQTPQRAERACLETSQNQEEPWSCLPFPAPLATQGLNLPSSRTGAHRQPAGLAGYSSAHGTLTLPLCTAAPGSDGWRAGRLEGRHAGRHLGGGNGVSFSECQFPGPSMCWKLRGWHVFEP